MALDKGLAGVVKHWGLKFPLERHHVVLVPIALMTKINI
jgi:hypothetical protein